MKNRTRVFSVLAVSTILIGWTFMQVLHPLAQQYNNRLINFGPAALLSIAIGIYMGRKSFRRFAWRAVAKSAALAVVCMLAMSWIESAFPFGNISWKVAELFGPAALLAEGVACGALFNRIDRRLQHA